MEKDGNEEMVLKTQIYLLKQSNRCNFNCPLSISFRNIILLKNLLKPEFGIAIKKLCNLVR
jgi:hypothetical protein